MKTLMSNVGEDVEQQKLLHIADGWGKRYDAGIIQSG